MHKTAQNAFFSRGWLLPLVSSLLSFPYTSRQFVLYLPMLLTALWHLSARMPNVDQRPDKRNPSRAQESIIGTT